MLPLDWKRLPGDDDRHVIYSVIEARRRDAAQVESAMTALENKLAGITKEIALMENYLAPVRRLNADCLGLIFDFCIEEDAMAPWKLAGVTSAWRKVLLESPVRWSHILIPARWLAGDYRGSTPDLPLDSSASGPFNFNSFVRLWIRRTGSSTPLDIKAARAMSIILQEVHRIRSFSYTPPDPGWSDIRVITPPVDSAPLLESVVFTNVRVGDSQSHTPQGDFASNTEPLARICDWFIKLQLPRLRTLRFKEVGESRAGWSFPPGLLQALQTLPQLSFTGRHHDLSELPILRLLSHCRQLRSLILLFPDFKSDPEPDDDELGDSSVEIPELREIELFPFRPCNAVLSALRTPQLATFTLTNGRHRVCPSPSSCRRALKAILKQDPAPPIERLSFDNVSACLSIDDLRRLSNVRSIYHRPPLLGGRRLCAADLSWLYAPLIRADDNGVWPLPLLEEIVVEAKSFDDGPGEESIYERFRKRMEESAKPGSCVAPLRLTMVVEN